MIRYSHFATSTHGQFRAGKSGRKIPSLFPRMETDVEHVIPILAILSPILLLIWLRHRSVHDVEMDELRRKHEELERRIRESFTPEEWAEVSERCERKVRGLT